MLLAVLLPAVALGQGWTESFSAAQLEPLLGGANLKVLVVGAGEPADEVARAAEALRARLRESGLASLVMDSAALGGVREDSDDTLRKKAATLPWDRLLIVRVFPGAKDAPPSAVITVSEPAGATRRSLVVTRAAPAKRPEEVKAQPPPAPVPEPVPMPVVVVAPPPPPPPVEPPPPPPKRDPRVLHFGQAIATKNRVGMVEQGVYLGAERIGGLELYQQLGRADFLERYDARARLKRTLGAIGGGVSALGLAGVIVTATSRCVRRQGTADGRCLQTEVPDLIAPSLIVAGVGVGLIVTALVLPSAPVPAEDLLPAIDAYNAALEKKPPVTLRLEPSLGIGSAGLALSGTF